MSTIADLNFENDGQVSILQFLRTQSSPAVEIRNIEAGGNTSVQVSNFLHGAADFLVLQNKMNELKKSLDSDGLAGSQRTEDEKSLRELLELEKSFKIDVLELANIFINLKVTSPRLVEAERLFEEGLFSDAGMILNEEDLTSEQDILFKELAYWQARKK
ncbi:MAG: hypothetical protein QM726_04260 [Chitinophagaceae bacterium]